MPNWKRLVRVLAPVLVFWCCGPAMAAPGDQVTVDIGVLIASGVSLSISPNSINFPSADPDTNPSIPASQNPVQVRCQINGRGHSNLYLYVSANSDLISGSSSIPIGQVSWTATGSGFSDGTMSTTQQQTGYWAATGNKTYNGSFSYFLQNDWNYAVGNYTAVVTYTLYSP